MYFKKFPLDLYSLDNRNSIQLVTAIYNRVNVRNEVKENLTAYDKYIVKEGETPEIVAYKFYGNSYYHWIILHTNDIIDPRFDWPLTHYQLERYVSSKYGGNEYIQSIHHYENSRGDWVNSNFPLATAVSNYAYEDQINEEKRSIRILKEIYLEQFIKEFELKIQA
jgi:hypothetical protein